MSHFNRLLNELFGQVFNNNQNYNNNNKYYYNNNNKPARPTTRGMSYFNRLPNELFGEVFKNLTCADLTSLSLVSHHLHTLVEPYLYKAPMPACSKLHVLLRNILARPILASHITSLELRGTGLTSITPEADVSRFTTAATEFKIGDPMGSDAAQVLLLLHLLPRLSDIRSIMEGDPNILDKFISQSGFLPSNALPVGLQSLQRIDFGWDDDHSVSSTLMLGMMLLPSIRYIRVHLNDDLPIDAAEIEKWTGESAVTDLVLIGALKLSSLELLLKLPKALETIDYYTYHAWEEGKFNVGEAWRVLEQQRQTLQFVHWQIYDSCHNLVEGPAHYTITSMRDWPELRRIYCSISRLLGYRRKNTVMRLVDVLPKAIEILEVAVDRYWTEEEVLAELVQLIELKEAIGLHSLKYVRFAGVGGRMRVVKLKPFFEAAGVKLVCHR